MAITLKIIPCGSIVTVTPGVEGCVTCVFIRYGYITYEVAYWLSGIQYKVVCDESEMQVSGGLKKDKVGFK